VALINLEGRGLLGKAGVDARIFRTLNDHDISVSIISQGSSERGISLIIDSNKAKNARIALEREFENDFFSQDVHKIDIIKNVSVISLIGIDLRLFHKPFNALIKNQIVKPSTHETFLDLNDELINCGIGYEPEWYIFGNIFANW
jgi:aspartokinase